MRRTAPARPLLTGAFLMAVLTACAGTAETAGPEPTAAPTSAAPSSTAPRTATPSATPTPAATTPAPVETTPPAPAGTLIELAVAGGEISGDTGRADVVTGQPVTLRVTSDVVEEVHVHGVDLFADLAPGETTTVEFTAPAPGLYEIELHDAGRVLTRMQST